MTKHSELIARLEALTGPDREVDWRVAESLGDIPSHSIREVGFDYDWYRRPNDFALWKATDSEGRSVELWQPKLVTGSIDAAVALCERVLPNFLWHAGINPLWEDGINIGEHYGRVCDRDWNEAHSIHETHKIPAVALLIATMKAMDAKEPS